MERIAIFPGSFDPFTRGHAAVVEEALNLFDRIVIGIGNNTAKQGLLTVANRKRLIDDVYAAQPRVEARIYTGLTGEFAESLGACAIIRACPTPPISNTNARWRRPTTASAPPSRPSCSSRRPPWPTSRRRPYAR